GAEFGIDGSNPHERIEQFKSLSNEGIAIFLEAINKKIQGSDDSLMNHKRAVRIGETETLNPADRYDVFTRMVEHIKMASPGTNPARAGDTLALGVVLLHPFHDGNGRTARLLGLMFRDEYDGNDYADDYAVVTEARDIARQRGGWRINGYAPNFPEGFNQSDPEQVASYLEGLLADEKPNSYTSCFGQSSLKTE
ncbi:Fic family protein, partial [Candidatus Saccharibacteria bacterium]|nr:Fic family protein [Candidatus Saccharibacteria bacterium]